MKQVLLAFLVLVLAGISSAATRLVSARAAQDETAVVLVHGALNIAEVSGQAVHVKARYRSARLNGISEQTYNLAPHEHQLIEFSGELGSIEATIEVSGEGSVLLSTPTPEHAGSAIRDVVAAPFKAAPFQDPDTGLIYMRGRWYDPRTGTFLTPDPQGYGDSSNLYAYCAGDPINCTDPTGTTGESDLAEERRAIAARRSAEAATRRAAEVRTADAADKALHDALQRFGTARMIELRHKYGINVRARSVVAILPDRLTAITASGEVIPNPYAGRIEDETAELVMSATALQVAAPVIATAFRTGGLRAGAVAVADEAIGQIVGVNPSAPIAVTRAITNAFEAQRALAELTRQVSAELAANPAMARRVLSRPEYEAAVVSERIAAAQYGNAVERLVTLHIESDPVLREVFEHVGGPKNPDFTGFGRNFDITTQTRTQLLRHMRRPGYGQNLIVVTYERPATFRTFPRQ
ncbi:MAG TPA: RHS repeat-associated core domain-containing protein [Thermoanaerobaculia bacterium]|nr:RHS repeat-associated core domain-containing protein [Thermoanaerobaculia bacterium]